MKAKRAFGYLVLTLLLILPLVLTPPDAPGQSNPSRRTDKERDSPDDVVRVDTNLVTIPAIVMDRDGRYVADLGKDDFRIFEDGVEQEVAFFASVDQSVTILFLLDTSGSMIYQMEGLARAANAFVRQLRPDDQLIAVSFDQWVDVLFKATRVRELRKGIKLRYGMAGSGPTTMIYDAVDDALKRMKKIRGRNAIVLFSDGVGSGFSATAKRNLRDAEEQDVLIYTVQFNTYPAEPPPHVNRKNYLKQVEEANKYMIDLAQRTGGRHYQVDTLSDLGQAFGLVADELRRQYSLGYYPKTPFEAGQTREIKVKMRLPNLVVRARDSYIVDKDRVRKK